MARYFCPAAGTKKYDWAANRSIFRNMAVNIVHGNGFDLSKTDSGSFCTDSAGAAGGSDRLIFLHLNFAEKTLCRTLCMLSDFCKNSCLSKSRILLIFILPDFQMQIKNAN